MQIRSIRKQYYRDHFIAFEAVHLTEEGTIYPEGDYCLGFVETKSTNKTSVNQLKIESIEGCAAMKSEAKVEDVLVIYCAKYPDTSVYESYKRL